MVNKRPEQKFLEKKKISLHPKLTETVTVIGVGEKGGDALEELKEIQDNPFTSSFRYVRPPISMGGKNTRMDESIANTDVKFSWENNTIETVNDDELKLEFLRSGFTPQSGIDKEHSDDIFSDNWLDRALLGRNPAYTRLRNFDSHKVKWAMDIVKHSDTLFILSDLMDESLDICLLLDALGNKADRRVILFLIQSDRYKDIWDVQFLNKRIQEVAMCAAGTMITPPTKFINLRGLPEILLALYGMIQYASTVNIDLADIRNITGFGNIGMMGVGRARGSNRTRKAVRKALTHPMLDIDLAGIERAIVYVNGGEDMTIEEAESASYYISKKIREGAKIIWGANVTPELNEKIEIVLLVGLTPHQALLHHYAGT